jgi:hypothetical protein
VEESFGKVEVLVKEGGGGGGGGMVLNNARTELQRLATK